MGGINLLYVFLLCAGMKIRGVANIFASLPEPLFVRGVRGHAPPEKFCDFRSSEMAFP